MKDRLLQLLTSENMTALKFAEIMEIRPSNVSHILSGRNNPNFDFVARLLRRFPELNPDWVLNGIGDMYRADFKHDFSAMGDEGSNEATVAANLFSDDVSVAEIEDSADLAPNTPVAPLNASQVDSCAPTVVVPPVTVSTQSTVHETEVPAHDFQVSGADNTAQTNPAPSQNNPERIVVSDAPKADRLVIIYADNTFEVLLPKSR